MRTQILCPNWTKKRQKTCRDTYLLGRICSIINTSYGLSVPFRRALAVGVTNSPATWPIFETAMSNQMYLRQLTLTNFKRHAKLEVNLDTALTVIRGPNYSGKSSVVEGIMFALGGATMVPGGRSVIVRTGAKDCVVSLDFKINDTNFEVTRTIKDASVTNDNHILLASGHTGVNSWIEQKLGMPIKDFITLSLSRQSETASLMTLGASKLNMMIEQLSGADFIDRVARKSSDRSKRAEGGLASLEPFTELGPLQERIDEQQAIYSDVQAKHAVTEDSVTVVHTELQQTQKALTEALRNNNERSILADRVKEQTETASTIEGWIVAARAKRDSIVVTDATALEAELEDLSQCIITNKVAASKLSTLKEKLVKEFAWINNTGIKALEAYRENTPLLAEAETKYEAARTAFSDAESDFKSKESVYEAAHALVDKGACPTCKRAYAEANLEQAKEELAKKRVELDTVTQVLDTARALRGKAKAQLDVIKAKLPTYDIEAQYAERESAVKSIEGDIATSTADVLRLESMLPTDAHINELKTAIGIAHRSQEALANAEKDIADKEASYLKQADKRDAAEAALAKLIEVPAAPLQEKANKLTGKLALVTAEQQQLKMQAMGHKTALEQSQKYYEQVKGMNEKRAKLEADQALYNGLTKYLRSNKTNFMQEMWDGLMEITSRFAVNVTDGYMESVSRSGEGDFTFVEDGVSKPILAASGGQKAIAGVGLRVALSSLLPGVTCPVLLDEPSSELNDELAAALAGALRAVDRQVVLVTHREGEAFLAENIITLER